MSEQGQAAEPIELDLNEPEQEAVEPTDIEKEAMEHGWTAEGVEGKRNLSAEEFMDRQPLYDDLKAQKKQIKRLQEGFEAMKQHTSGIAERERAKVIAELKEAKKSALENENYDAVVEIDEQIADTKAQDPAPKVNETFNAWIDENEWYHQDSEMKNYADTIGAGYAQQNPNKPLTEVYNYVASETKKRFPDKFGNPNRGKPSPVEGASKGRQSTSKKYSAKDLPEDDRRIMRTLVRAGMDEQEYLKQYFS